MASIKGNMRILRLLRASVSFQKWKFARANVEFGNILTKLEGARHSSQRHVHTSYVMCKANKKEDRVDDADATIQASPPLMAQLLSKHSKLVSSDCEMTFEKDRDTVTEANGHSSRRSFEGDNHGRVDSLLTKMDELRKEMDEIERDTQALIKKNEARSSSDTTVEDNLIETTSLSEKTDDNENFVEFVTLDDDNVNISRPRRKKKPSIYGTPDPRVPKSDIPCVGCGAILHCQEEREQGYMPSEKFLSLTSAELRKELCQRCFLIKHHKIYLNVGVTTKEYPAIIERIKNTYSLVVVVVDLTDIENSIYSDLLEHIGTNRPLYVVGNKADLIPRDHQRYLSHLREALVEACERAGLNPSGRNLKHVCLVSAKTGYGMEDLITQLITHWGNKGDVYLVGSTNAGKSTLFNALLASDYCKSNVQNIIHRATVSNWPGTTLNLLKFPIVTPTPWRLKQRNQRLQTLREEEKMEKLRAKMEKKERRKPMPSLLAHVGVTDFRNERARELEEQEAGKPVGQEMVSFLAKGDTEISEAPETPRAPTEEELLRERYHAMYQLSKWHYDTPGVIQEQQVINHLTTEELAVLVPGSQLKARVFVVKPGHSLLISGLGRLDYVEGSKSAFFTVVCSKSIPIFVKPVEEAEEFYREHVGTKMLGVPLGDAERLSQLPPLAPTEFSLVCQGFDTATADIQLSSLGWVAVAGGYMMSVKLRGYTVGGLGCYLRQPPLLPHYKKFRGKRIGRGSEYHPIVPAL